MKREHLKLEAIRGN
ncbi:hypothetical protein AAHA92_04103 [Salvia divinorum]|uniref:Uncharacterized protein n=1 Tax=Salvia divinorum TaxID=28513 RepID=A0ABD1HY44_SALDI